MEWIREDVNFKYINNKDNVVILHNKNSLKDEFHRYAKFFLDTANIVIDYMIESPINSVKDHYFFPLIYLYRQSIELLLKGNVLKYTSSKSEQKEYFKLVGHNLSYSFEVFQAKCNCVNTTENEDILWLEEFINHITYTDSESDVFRYPFSNSGKKYFQETKTANLRYLKINFNTAYKILMDLDKDKCIEKTTYEHYEPNLFIDRGLYEELSIVGWGMSFSKYNFYPYINGYTEVAGYIRKYIIEYKNYDLFLPMCYIFRNAVELSLKRILIEDTGIEDKNSMKKIQKKKHSVLGLWNSIKSTIEECSPSEEDTTIESAEKYIRILQDFDCSSSKFRYPVNKDVEYHFSKKVVLDIENVALFFNELLNFLDGVDGELTARMEWQMEIQSYYDY